MAGALAFAFAGLRLSQRQSLVTCYSGASAQLRERRAVSGAPRIAGVGCETEHSAMVFSDTGGEAAGTV